MSTVYLVWEGRYDAREVSGVYDSLEGAMAAHPAGHEPEWDVREDEWDCRFSVPAPELPVSRRRFCDFYIERHAVVRSAGDGE